jgi:hypothetical protein
VVEHRYKLVPSMSEILQASGVVGEARPKSGRYW